MSFSGFSQVLCKSGHYFQFDCYDEPDLIVDYGQSEEQWAVTEENAWKCPHCGELAAWRNGVDTTNGSYEEYIGKKEEKILIEKNIDFVGGNGTPNKKFWLRDVNEKDGYWYGTDKDDNKVKLYPAERIDGYVNLEIKEKREGCSCPKCGHCHIAKAETYHIPQEEGQRINENR